MKIGCVIMASGMARRFGSNKLLHDFHGEPMMVRILRSTAQCDFTHRLVVTRHPEVESICQAENVPCLLHDLPRRSDTVRLGVEKLLEKEPELDGIMFAASDQPCLKAVSIQKLLHAFEENPASCRVMAKSGMHLIEETEVIAYRGKDHRCIYYEINK